CGALAHVLHAVRRSARVVLPGIEGGQRAVVLRHMDLGAVAVGTGLVLPLAGAQRAFDEHLRALREVFLDDLAEALVEDHDAVPLGPLLAFTAVAILPAFAGSDAQRDDTPAVLHDAHFGVVAQVADQLHAVSRHDLVPSFPPQEGSRLRAGVVPSGAVSRNRQPDR